MAFPGTRTTGGRSAAHGDVLTLGADNLADFATEPFLDGDSLGLSPSAPKRALTSDVLRPASDPVAKDSAVCGAETGHLGPRRGSRYLP